MDSSYLLTDAFRRTDYTGLTNRYNASYTLPGAAANLENALNGKVPFDVVGNAMSAVYRDAAAQRIARYRENWLFYRGDHWPNPYQDGKLKPVTNFCKKIADKGVDWMIAKGWTTSTPTGNEGIAEYLERVWQYNGRDTIMLNAVGFGAVAGDSFLYVTVRTKDDEGKDLPKDQWWIKVDSLNPAYVFPFFDAKDRHLMTACLIQFPILYEGRVQLYSLFIERDTWQEFFDNQPSGGKKPNPFGKVNVVHIPNLPQSDSLFGTADLDPIKQLNQTYNGLTHTVEQIITYQGEPTTLIFGARASELERGANKVWSNLPIDAKVENLQLTTDLAAINTHIDRTEQSILVMGETPKVALENLDSTRMSNTSGIAMQLMFKPLLDKTDRRRFSWKLGLTKVNELILIAGDRILGEDIASLADKETQLYYTEPEFTSPLPADRTADLDESIKKVQNRIWSQAEAIRRVSGVKDTQRLALEIAADDRFDLALTLEKQRALTLEQPNLSVVFLSSAALSEDLEDIAQQSQELEQSHQDAIPDPEIIPAPTPEPPKPGQQAT